MKKLLVIPILIFLTGCDPQQIQQIQYQYSVILAPNSLFNCPIVTRWPKIETLTDLEVAHLIVQLAQDNHICATSMASIKKFYADASARIEGRNPAPIKPLPTPPLAKAKKPLIPLPLIPPLPSINE